MTTNKERLTFPIQAQKIEAPKVTRVGWRPSEGQENLRLKMEQEAEAFRLQQEQMFEALPHTKMIRDLEKQIVALQKEVKALSAKK